jgi:myo-inositol-1(or 4)-monophosphatase
VESVNEPDLLAIAREAANAAAAELCARFGQRAEGVHSKSSPTDLVSDTDVAAETAIRAVLARARPDDAILGEEGGQTGSTDGGLRWIVDPLDGTINYLFGQPVFAVSVACEDASGLLVGVVLDPMRDECFAATRSGPAMRNGTVIQGSQRSELSRALVATGFGYEVAVRARQADVVGRVLPRVRDIRRGGSAAIDLCWCACGRLDAYYERGVHRWDVAAGGLVAVRAGLQMRELPASGADPWGIVAGPPGLVDELYELVAGDG